MSREFRAIARFQSNRETGQSESVIPGVSRARRLNQLRGSPTRERDFCINCEDAPRESAMGDKL
eukprot:3318992-Pyramimonas_sp.AAC.1